MYRVSHLGWGGRLEVLAELSVIGGHLPSHQCRVVLQLSQQLRVESLVPEEEGGGGTLKPVCCTCTRRNNMQYTPQ